MFFVLPVTALWSGADSLIPLKLIFKKIIAKTIIVIKKVVWYGSRWHCLQIFCAASPEHIVDLCSSPFGAGHVTASLNGKGTDVSHFQADTLRASSNSLFRPPLCHSDWQCSWCGHCISLMQWHKQSHSWPILDMSHEWKSTFVVLSHQDLGLLGITQPLLTDGPDKSDSVVPGLP